jgi:hypothetical protein
MASRKKFTETTIKILWAKSGNRCAFPGCSQALVEEATTLDGSQVVGEMAHIVAHSSDEGPRCDPDFPRDKIDLPENLILLCPTHHTIVDKQANTYTVADLLEWKQVREAKTQEGMAEKIMMVGAEELEQILGHLGRQPARPATEIFLPTDPSTKMTKNNLTSNVRGFLEMGMLRSRDVSQYVSHMAQIDRTFPERLRDTFRSKYDELKAAGQDGDEVFFGILEWARQGRGAQEAAVFPVITYLFESCELFEP